ncbi:MAG TPA: cellulase family glycosylhydrolase [Ohtaekwangia sp.]|nr:cellulase family glycosylhydrolase [Ohtaekwangia sp.]
MNYKSKSLSVSILCMVFFILVTSVYAQKRNDVYVDKNGVMRWGMTNEEVHGFGVNYTVPFAHAYRAAEKLDINPEQAIDGDVYHFARLGFDAFRIHVWDTEISDSVGNLLENEHLRLFDYALMKMKERGIKIILTPIAFWGNGYPEPNEKTPGFATKYGKDKCLTEEGAIKAQERYLFQFLNHVNPYTKTAYKDDADIVAFEISNEPHHRGTPKEVTRFIQRMVKSMRKTGCAKPIFYNVSHSIHLYEAYYKAGIQGGTFQWYPTGLGAQHELGGNFLPNVDQYVIPFADNPAVKKTARIVYEFDAADVGRSYIYPAMARSFREAGIQWATHFAYDPTYMAYANTEYNTHYMNLVYTPQKAISLKLAGEVFHEVPMYKSFGRYPANTTFDSFRVSYENDLAEMVTGKKFIYTNHTTTTPPAPANLETVCGYGNSPVVSYGGTGAYFLDKIEPGVWRLEVLPDAIWIANPFGRNSLDRKVAIVNWRSWSMEITLPDLGSDFQITKLNEAGDFKSTTSGTSFSIKPGTYLLSKKGTTPTVTANSKWKNITLNEYEAPQANLEHVHVLHEPLVEVRQGNALPIHATVATKDLPTSVKVYVFNGFRPTILNMEHIHGYNYQANIPAEMVKEGFLAYYIVVEERDKTTTFPSGESGLPTDWDFETTNAYRVPVVNESKALYLFDAISDHTTLSRQWRVGNALVPTEQGRAKIVIAPNELFSPDPENPNGKAVFDYSMRYHFAGKVEGRRDEIKDFKRIVVKGRSLQDKPCKVQIALVTKAGVTHGSTVTLDPQMDEHTIEVNNIKAVLHVTLPRPYPTFLPYYFKNETTPFKMEEVETIQISIGPGIEGQDLKTKHGIAIESIRLE